MTNIRKILNIIFAVSVAFVLFGTITSEIALKVFPQFSTFAKSNFELKDHQILPAFSIDAVANKTFQSQFSDFMADETPFRDHILLGNASVQRCVIQIANSTFSFPAYPTYLGSEYVYIPEYNAVQCMPDNNDEQIRKGLADTICALNCAARDNPDTEFVICVVGGYKQPAASIVYDLMSNPFTYQDAERIFYDRQEDLDNISFIFIEYNNTGEYYSDFYKSDHHWNPRGAYKAYSQIMDALGKTRLEVQEYSQISEGYFTGSLARAGMYLIDDVPFDYAEHFDGLTSITSTGEAVDVNAHAQYENAKSNDRRFNMYSLYYGDITGNWRYVKDNQLVKDNSKTETLYVSDSFGLAVERLFAATGGSVWADYSLHENRSESKSYSEKKNELKTVVMIGYPGNYATFMERNPYFFTG